ncbi:MAG: hypothetical protein Q7T25_03300 [Sideroxyarcus sp.]|nr:hypothetical protein [Sideroxyarcus sp.]
MKVCALSAVVMALLSAIPCLAENTKMCPQLEGKQVKVSGVLRNLMIGGQREPGEAPSSYFELDHPRWDCKLKKVYVDYPGERLWCSEGRRVEVSGTYHEGDLFPGYNVITAREVRCR